MDSLAGMRGLAKFFRVLIWVVVLTDSVKCNPTYPKDYLPSLLHKHTRRDSTEDQSWIKTWAAVGDSYAAGIGAGSRLSGIGDYFCSRYNESYPSLINSDKRLGDPSGRKFTFWACSGAVTPKVTSDQVTKLDDNSQQMITVSSGGNDVGLVDILNHCIFQWNPSIFPSCSYYLTKAQNTIDSDNFSKNLDNLLSTAKGKLTSDGTIYWSGYAQFFATDDKQCDSITWSFLWTIPRREYLTLDRRQAMNSLVVNVNQKIKDAVQRAGSQAVFVDYDKYYQSTLARFCEAGYAEPFGNREGLLFYEYYTDDTVDPDTPDNQKVQSTRSGNPLMNGTFEAEINTRVQEYLQNHGSEVQLVEAPVGSDHFDTNPSPDQENIGTQASIIPDSYGRVFHPRRGGHTLMSNMVLWQMQIQKAKRANQQLPKMEVDGDTCPKGATPDTVAPVVPPSQPSCVAAPAGPVKDSHEDELQKVATFFCDQYAKDTVPGPVNDVHTVMAGTKTYPHETIDIAFDYTGNSNEDDVYDIKVTSVDKCTANGGYNLAEPVPNYKCYDILYTAWKNCANQGRGGDIVAGCLVYSIHTKY